VTVSSQFAGDADLDAMLAGVRMQLDLAAEDRSVREVERVLRDVAVVTRSTLIGLGESPRSPRCGRHAQITRRAAR